MNAAILMKDLEMRGLLQYVVMDVMTLAPEELPAKDSLVCYYTNLEELLDPNLLITYAYWICKAKGHVFCEHVFGAWTSAMLSLPSSACSSSLLNGCVELLGRLDDEFIEGVMRATDPDVFARADYEDEFQDFHDKEWPFDSCEDCLHRVFASGTIEVVKKLDARTIQEAFCRNGNEEEMKGDLWKLVGEHGSSRESPFLICGGLNFGLGAEVMMALIEKGLPRWCWAGLLGPYNDNLLLYILAPMDSAMHWYDEAEAKGRLCIFLAEKFSLEELCREDVRGRNALSYAESIHDRVEIDVWVQLHRVIAQRMVPCVREFQGSLPKLIDLAKDVHYGLQGDLSLFRMTCF